MVWKRIHSLALFVVPVAIVVSGCGGRVSAFSGDSSQNITIQASSSQIDTNGSTHFTATLANGESARVEWAVSGGDPSAGPGVIRADGLYTPPSYLTREAVEVAVTAVLAGSEPNRVADTAELTITPGFLQPLTPGNLTLGPGGSVTVSGSMTEVGGSGGIHFSLASDPTGTPSATGALSSQHCVRGSVEGSNPAYTVCSVTYTAPASISGSGAVYLVGSVVPAMGSGLNRSWTRIQLNNAGINSNPAAHQAHLAAPISLGSSSGNNSDYDASLGQLSDCCGGTLGALLQDASGNQFALSNNHVLARSDQSLPGETVIQPGLIDNGCTPYGFGPGTTPVATLTGYPALSSPATNVDAAIARVTRGAIDPKGGILELGAKQQDGTLSPAPPGISSSGGKGEAAVLGMMVAKSGRTTGLTCAAVSAISVDVTVDYFSDCAETSDRRPKTFTNQIAIAGTNFSDAGDSGALVVDTANAEPVGLFFAGGTDEHGVEQAIANPAGDVLTALDAQAPGASGPTNYSFVGGADHPVSCLSYGGVKPTEEVTLTSSERERAEIALPLAELLVNTNSGIARVSIASSKDHPGQVALAFYLDPGAVNLGATLSAIPPTLGGVATTVLKNGGQGLEALPSQLRATSLALALAAKQRNAAVLMKSNPAIFGVGVGQSLDNPSDAALVLFVDRGKIAQGLPESVEGQRVKVIAMDRLHVTRSHGTSAHAASSCFSPHRPSFGSDEPAEPADPATDPSQDRLQLPE